MIKENKIRIAISMLLTLLPMFIGLCFWGKISEGHEAVMRSVKTMAVFVLPLTMCLMNALCIVITHFDTKRVAQHKKIISMVLWIMPLISTYVSLVFYSILLGWDINIMLVTSLIMGVLFIITGNYIPKSKQNRTFGIKIRWTLANEENWNATHRMAGKLWFFAGFLVIFAGFLPMIAFIITFFAIVITAVIIPTLYSYLYYKNNVKSGKQSKDDYVFERKKQDKVTMIIVCAVIGIILIICAFVMFTGKIDVSVGNDALEIDATFYSKETIAYSDIASIEYRTEFKGGMRVMGFASARLLMGTFENDEFGKYSRFSYTKNNDEIIINLKSGGKVVVNCETEAETRELYESLGNKIVG